MNEGYLLLMSAFFEVLVTYQLFDHFCERKEMPRSKVLGISAVTIAVITAVSLLKKFPLNTIVMLLGSMCYAKMLFKCKTSYAIFGSAVFVMIGMVAEIGTGFGVSFAFNIDTVDVMLMTDYKIVVYFISNALVLIIARFIIAVLPSAKHKEINKIQLYLIVFPVFAILNEFLLLYLAIKFELERGSFFVCMLVGIGLVYGGLMLIMVYEQGIQKCVLENELCLARQKEEANETFYHLQEKNIEELRAVMHDFKKQLLNLKELYGDGDSEAEQYHQLLMQTLDEQIKRQMIDVNNKVLSSILQRTQIYCEQMQIEFAFTSEVYELGFLSPMDTSTIFDNAIDNAVEACSKMSDAFVRKLDISIRKLDYFILIDFCNTYEMEPVEKEGKLVTTKGNDSRHGYGIANIFAAAQKYGGDGLYQYEDGIFHLFVRIQPQGENSAI